jgi:hypothetical protein
MMLKTEILALADKITRSYLFTLNKGGPTEKDLSRQEIDVILAALRVYAESNGN